MRQGRYGILVYMGELPVLGTIKLFLEGVLPKKLESRKVRQMDARQKEKRCRRERKIIRKR
jgi:hypothetical protein